jgi:CheY-like chemotaxis protein
MDVQMPDMDGHEATLRIRENPAFKDLPILAMTAGAMAEDKEKAKQAGMNDHVSKPIEIRKLFEALTRWIQPGERATPPVEKQVNRVGLADKLPPYLEGINIGLGLRRIGGSPSLYRDLLIKFRDSNARVIQEIRAALEAEDLELAIRLAHTLTGVAGNLGANELALAAKDLELGITSDGSGVAPVLLESTQSHLDQVISALSVIQREGRSHTTAGPVSWDQVQETLVRLRDALENYDTNARDLIGQLSGQLTDESFAEPLKAIEVVVDNFEFEMALDHLVELEELVSSTSQNPAQS